MSISPRSSRILCFSVSRESSIVGFPPGAQKAGPDCCEVATNRPGQNPNTFTPWIRGIYFFINSRGAVEKRWQALGIIYMSKHVRSRVSASMRIKAIYRGFDAQLALWSSLPHSLDHTTFNPLLALVHVGLLLSLPSCLPFPVCCLLPCPSHSPH